MKVKQTNSYLAPSSVRQDIELPFAKQSVYSDGTTGWLVTPQGAMAYDAASAQASARRSVPRRSRPWR